MINQRMLVWIAFWAFVVVSWAIAGFYFFIAGWSSCEATSSCVVDRFAGIAALLLMPAQVLLAVYLKQHLKG
jgi:hypothetical protein